MQVNGQDDAPVALPLTEKNFPGTHWIGNCMDLKAGLDVVARR
jgi:hypothetical protein